jgi:hypothetical protein
MTFAEASRLISFKAEPEDLMNHIYPVSRATAPKVPASFDWRQQSPQCVHPVLDQAAWCASIFIICCWPRFLLIIHQIADLAGPLV